MSVIDLTINWKNHSDHIKNVIEELLKNNELTDVTIFIEGNYIKAHKVILSACSLYFRQIFKEIKEPSPIVIINGIEHSILLNILDFMYNGEVHIKKELFDDFMRGSKSLQVCGLTYINKESLDKDVNSSKVVKSVRKRPIKNNKVESSKICKNDIKEELVEVFEDNSQFLEENVLFDAVLKQENKSTEEYTCDICGKTYQLKDSLKRHYRVHDGATTCSICSKVLSRKTHLERHLITKHGIVSN
ncbi:unnamed protein product [Brassicogethes aeneus]|uniref:Uncharacterized protein n=1 Tax=Brassicogethes aeneus TaxID=1431903 RepID=A0A9P0B8Q2_BRAAE|nr:unnamed protein product [Brassicogethes aeneus]